MARLRFWLGTQGPFLYDPELLFDYKRDLNPTVYEAPLVFEDVNGNLVAVDVAIGDASPASFYPYNMIVGGGTLDWGVVEAVQTLDGNYISISEASGANPLLVTFQFSDVTKISALTFFARYAGSPSHQLSVEIFNYGLPLWESIGIVGSEPGGKWYSFPIYNYQSYISAGAVTVRFRHIQNGINTHEFLLDYLELSYSFVGGSSSISAAAITFIPAGNISATNVGEALVELDTEKQPLLTSGTNIKTINGNTLLGSGDLVISNTTTNGIFGRNISNGSTTVSWSHGLGRTPDRVKISGWVVQNGVTQHCIGCFNGTVHSGICVIHTEGGATAAVDSIYSSTSYDLGFSAETINDPFTGTNRQNGVISVSSTQISIAWTLTGTIASADATFLWECS